MENVTLLDENQNQFNAELVRYFNAQLGKYLVYTLDEKDENGYVKLYATKLSDSLVAEKIEDEEEWTKFKDLIRVIVHESKQGLVEAVEDLNPADLKSVTVSSYRLFKLAEVVVELFGSNKKEFKVLEEHEGTLDDLLGKEQPSYTPFYGELDENKNDEEVSKEPTMEKHDEEVSKEPTMEKHDEEVSEEPTMEQPVVEPNPINEFELPKAEQTFELPNEESFTMPTFQQSVVDPLHNDEQVAEEPTMEEPEETIPEQQEPMVEHVEEPEQEEVESNMPTLDYEKLYLEEKSKNEELMIKIDKIKELL